MKKLILFVTALFMMTGIAYAGEVCLEWDANTEPDLAGYKIFTRAEGDVYNYANPIWQGVETTCSFTMPDGETFYFVAHAFDTEGLESGDSNEVSWYHEFPWINTPPGTVNLRIIDCGSL